MLLNRLLLLCTIGIFLPFNNSKAQTVPFHKGLNAKLNPAISQNTERKTDENTVWTEDISERKTHSSTYRSNDGQIKSISSQRPINYYNDKGILVPISPKLEVVSPNYWAAQQQPFPTYLYKDASFGLTLNNREIVRFGKNCMVNGQATFSKFNFTGNEINVSNVASGIDKQLLFYENSVKYNYVLKAKQESFAEGLIFSEEIELPSGYSVVQNKEIGKQTSTGWMGELNIINRSGKIESYIQVPLCVDAKNEWSLASYKIEQKNGKTILHIIMDQAWLNNSDRSYPIIVDPIVTGPTASWTGGNMPSCIMPNYNKDSILVIIPGGVTITQLNVTASFYADPWTTATMGQGAMMFSTSCATSTSFTITGTTANTPGTAYLDNYDLASPLTCCFTESCNQSSFYLRMHLGRTGPGTGCNATYIRYDAASTLWPFRAVVVGKTAESYSGMWTVPQTPICSNSCTITGKAYVNYGVAPYTFSHPWSTEVITQGTNVGCSTGANFYNFTLTIPNCPNFCDVSNTTLTVPPPVIVDACGTVVTGIPSKTVPLKTAPKIDVIYDTTICSGSPYLIELNSCIPSATVDWWGNDSNGSGNIIDTIVNNGNDLFPTGYVAVATVNGCTSDTVKFPLYVQPLPIADYVTNPETVIANVPTQINDASVDYQASINSWDWDLGDNTQSTEQNNTRTYPSPGSYNICLKVTDDNNCIDSICKVLQVVPAEIVAPNVITANKDGINDLLAFRYLEFYPENSLVVTNRWGNTILEKDGYQNDWDGDDLKEGVYFYLLKIPSIDKTYQGFFQLKR
jgi:gliding motility-associated-like protein